MNKKSTVAIIGMKSPLELAKAGHKLAVILYVHLDSICTTISEVKEANFGNDQTLWSFNVERFRSGVCDRLAEIASVMQGGDTDRLNEVRKLLDMAKAILDNLSKENIIRRGCPAWLQLEKLEKKCRSLKPKRKPSEADIRGCLDVEFF